MNPEIHNNLEMQSQERRGKVNLTRAVFEFCSDDVVRTFYDQKLHELEDREKWLEENQHDIENDNEKIAKAVADGVLEDSRPETIWKFQVHKAKEGLEKAPVIKSELESNVDKIKEEVAKRLGKFLPDWFPDQVRIVFNINEKADYSIDDNTITVDLGRMIFESDPIEKVKAGVTHEVFHFWMSEKSRWSDVNQAEVSDAEFRERIVFKTVDEGLAVLVSGQSLEDHHMRQDRNYPEYIVESFDSFNRFLSENDRERLEYINDAEFQNMGHFYVVGNAIAQAVLQHDGIDNFRELIAEARENPAMLLQRYKEFCDEDIELPIINV